MEDENIILLNNEIYLNNNNILLSIINQLQNIINDINNNKQINIVINQLKNIIMLINKVIIDNKKNLDQIRNDIKRYHYDMSNKMQNLENIMKNNNMAKMNNNNQNMNLNNINSNLKSFNFANHGRFQLKPDSEHDHGLNREPSNDTCKICQKTIDGQPAYICHQCPLVLCLNCSNFIFYGNKKKFIHPHPLVLRDGNLWRCDICKQKFRGIASFRCQACDFDVCSRCYIGL